MKSFLTGLATGLAIGYLTAPRSGKETREQFTEAANKQAEGLKGQWDKTTSQVSQLVDDVKAKAGVAKTEMNAFADKAEDEFDSYRNDAQRAKNQARNQYNDGVDSAADAAKSGVDKAEDALKF